MLVRGGSCFFVEEYRRTGGPEETGRDTNMTTRFLSAETHSNATRAAILLAAAAPAPPPSAPIGRRRMTYGQPIRSCAAAVGVTVELV